MFKFNSCPKHEVASCFLATIDGVAYKGVTDGEPRKKFFLSFDVDFAKFLHSRWCAGTDALYAYFFIFFQRLVTDAFDRFDGIIL